MGTHFKGPVSSELGFVASTFDIADLAVTTAKLNADAVTNAKLADNAVSLENLDSGIAPAYFVKYAGAFTTLGGDANESITVSGATSSDIAIVTLKTKGAVAKTILTAAANTDAIDVVMSGDPSTDHVIAWMILRLAS